MTDTPDFSALVKEILSGAQSAANQQLEEEREKEYAHYRPAFNLSNEILEVVQRARINHADRVLAMCGAMAALIDAVAQPGLSKVMAISVTARIMEILENIETRRSGA